MWFITLAPNCRARLRRDSTSNPELKSKKKTMPKKRTINEEEFREYQRKLVEKCQEYADQVQKEMKTIKKMTAEKKSRKGEKNGRTKD